jgi:hypothetical protein
MKILIKCSVVEKKEEQKENNKIIWYDDIKQEIQSFDGGKLFFEYKEDPYLVSMKHEERIQKNIVSNYRLLPKIIDNKRNITIIKGGTSNSSPLFNVNSIRSTNNQLSRYVNNYYANTRAKAILTIHINEYKLQENQPRVLNRNGIEVKRIKARDGSDSLVEKAVTYKEYEKKNTLSSNVTYSLVEIKTGKILMQKTIQKSDEKEVRYARYTSTNSNLIYPTRIIGTSISKDESNYKVLQNLFQTPETINNEQLSNTILNDFRRRITNDVLVFNPEE